MPNRRNIDESMIRHCAEILGIGVVTGCRSCLHGTAVDLKNLYNRLKPSYDIEQRIAKEQRELEELKSNTLIVEPVVPEEPVIEEKVITKPINPKKHEQSK